MVTFVVLLTYTEKGTKALRETAKRAQEFAAAASRMGVNVRAVYWTAGSYDGVLILEGPDEETVVAQIARLASLGFVKTNSMRAYDRTGVQTILNRT